MKLLFTIPKLTYSGAPKMMAWVANQMAMRGHEVHLVTFFSEEQARILHENICIHSLQVKQSKKRLIRNTLGMFKTIARLHKKVRQLKPDVVVSFLDSVGYVYLPIGSAFTRSKFVVSERVDPYAYRGRTAKLRFQLMQYADAIVFQTEGARRFFESFKGIYHNSTVIPNPVVVSDEIRTMQQHVPSAAERDRRIVTVGRMSLKQKRQDVLLEAFRLFHEKHPGYMLVLYGDGQDMDKIKDLIEQSNLSDSVVLAGRTNQVEKEIFCASAFVLSSDYEGIPNALIEAMSIGVPSVSTDCSPGGAALLIRDGENGFLVPREDATAIAERLSRIVETPEISERISKAAIEITDFFSEQIIADKWESYFEHVVNNKE
ncbi:MAG: glycosyltransferase family 4 protein [Ruminococcaceae bacterium]|nr:glycosyltransferase family 4 protein [Oscillospiraceae bacterium]